MPSERTPGRASFADWLAVAAGVLGVVMGQIDASIVNASLPVIQGEIGATPSEGTWVGTAYLVVEIVVIPMTAWLERMLGMRRLLLGSVMLFTLFSVICGLATNLEMMVFGRVGQGLAGGILIPTGLTIVAKRLPPSQQPIGLAVTAVAAMLGPIAGPLLGGWLTENYSWHYAFFINVPVCFIQVVLLMVAITGTAGSWREFRNADWVGVTGMIVGLGAITTLLEEGHREQWFDSPLIWKLAVASVIGFSLIVIGQLYASRPVLRLALLRNWSLASATALMAVLGVLLYTSLFMIPQFLVAVSGYNALQAGQVVFVSGIVAIPSAFLYTIIVTRVDLRLIVAGAVLCVAIAALIASSLTAQSTGTDFTFVRLLFGAGTTLCAIPLQQTVISSVPVDDAAEANSMVVVSRNLGGSMGLAAIASFQDQRFEFHHWQLNASLGGTDLDLQQQITSAADLYGGGPAGLEAAYRALDGEVMVQALVMTFNDMFLALATIGMIVIPLVLFLRPVKPGTSPVVMH
ncbi:MAG: DHA2 family efflux MFS transporter permease subunit [Rhodospirillaceae bacterium]|nr:MAG: DHA2 family efflux MFS transporter permease subunit [Rhodospirillaceae bacterium]